MVAAVAQAPPSALVIRELLWVIATRQKSQMITEALHRHGIFVLVLSKSLFLGNRNQ